MDEEFIFQVTEEELANFQKKETNLKRNKINRNINKDWR